MLMNVEEGYVYTKDYVMKNARVYPPDQSEAGFSMADRLRDEAAAKIAEIMRENERLLAALHAARNAAVS